MVETEKKTNQNLRESFSTKASEKLKIFYLRDTRMPTRRSSTLQVMYTCNGLANRGNSVKLFITSWGRSRITIDGIFEFYGMEKTFEIQRLPTINWTRRTQTWSFVILAVPYVLANMLRRGKPDIVYIRGVAVAWTFLIASKFLGLRVFYETQELGSEIAPRVHELVDIEERKSRGFLERLRLAERFIFENADGIVVGTEALKQALTDSGIPGEKIRVIPDGFDPQRFEFPKEIRDPKVDRNFAERFDLVGYAGHLYYWKGVDCLVDAMALVAKDFPRAKLLIVGGPPGEPDIERVRKLVEKRGISENVVFTGYVQPDEVPHYLGLSKILTIPTLDTVMGKYAMPMKIFEYMAAGKAIIATDLDAHKQILEHRKTALLVPAGNPRRLASAIKTLLRDTKLIQSLGSNAKRIAYEQYSWESRARRIEEFVQAVRKEASIES